MRDIRLKGEWWREMPEGLKKAIETQLGIHRGAFPFYEEKIRLFINVTLTPGCGCKQCNWALQYECSPVGPD